MTAKLLSEIPDHVSTIEKLARKIKDTEKLQEVLSKIEKLENNSKLFTDLAENTKFADEFFEKLAGNSGFIATWEILETSADFRKNIEALETLGYYTKHANSNIEELTNAFKAASSKEDWFSSIIAEIRSRARNLPGTSSGKGVAIEGKWMRGTEGNAGLFPKSIADKLQGREFKNFDEFRSEFWKAVADDPKLIGQFDPVNQGRIKKGLAPKTAQSQKLGEKRAVYEIHHKTPIHDGGAVYDMDNMVIVTPRYHKEILDPAYHFKK